MNREIKFRGKAKLNSKYHYGSLLKGTDGKLYIGELICPKEKVDERMSMVGRVQGKQMRQYMAMGFLEVIPKTVGQYTGLKDKNGVEIYENDCLGNFTEYKDRYRNAVIKFGEHGVDNGEGNFAYAYGYYIEFEYLVHHGTKHEYWETFTDAINLLEFEVIGNIHNEE